MNNETPEFVAIELNDFEEMESDLEYWIASTTMLSELLASHNIEHTVSEEAVAEYLERKNEELL